MVTAQTNPIKIISINQLEEVLKDGENHEFFISLADGGLRSSKTIYAVYNKKNQMSYEVFHSIDGHCEAYNKKTISKTNIGKAIERGCFWMEA